MKIGNEIILAGAFYVFGIAAFSFFVYQTLDLMPAKFRFFGICRGNFKKVERNCTGD
jgi:hypothetical protein